MGQETTFRSRPDTLRLVIEPKRRIINERGESQLTEGKRIEFENGVFTTSDKDELKALRDHEQKDRLFWEQGDEPDRPQPNSSDAIERVIKALTDKDADRLVELYKQERSTHSRKEVLTAIATGLEGLKKDVPEPPAVPAHEVERARLTEGEGHPATPGDGIGPAAPIAPAGPEDQVAGRGSRQSSGSRKSGGSKSGSSKSSGSKSKSS